MKQQLRIEDWRLVTNDCYSDAVFTMASVALTQHGTSLGPRVLGSLNIVFLMQLTPTLNLVHPLLAFCTTTRWLHNVMESDIVTPKCLKLSGNLWLCAVWQYHLQNKSVETIARDLLIRTWSVEIWVLLQLEMSVARRLGINWTIWGACCFTHEPVVNCLK